MVEHLLDRVFQHQLAALQPGDLQLVGEWLFGKGEDLFIEASMLRLHRIELFLECIVHSFRNHPVRILTPLPVGRDEPRLQSVGLTLRIRDKGSEKCFTHDAIQSHSRKGMAPMDKAHVEELTSQHANLAAKIDEEEHRPLPDMIKLHELKKEKLRLKDELAGHFH